MKTNPVGQNFPTLAVSLIAVLLCTVGASAEERSSLRWEDSSIPVPYFIERRGCDDISDGTEFSAIQSAFQTWENVATGGIEFQFAGLMDKGDIDPGSNIVMWMEEDWPYDPSYVAMTKVYYGREDGKVSKVEMMLNSRDYRWSTNGETGSLDVQNVATHEIGHFIGIMDTQIPGQTMFEYILPGETEKVRLTDADIDTLHEKYPFIPRGSELFFHLYLLDHDNRKIYFAAKNPEPYEAEGYLSLCQLTGEDSLEGYAGLVTAHDDTITLSILNPEGDVLHSYNLFREYDIKTGRIRAILSVDLNGDGRLAEFAALVSTPEGPRAYLCWLPPLASERAPMRTLSLPVRGADDLVAFTPLHVREGGFENVLVTAHKRQNSEFYISLTRAQIRYGRNQPEIVLEQLRSWKVYDCISILGLTTVRLPNGSSEIAVLMRTMNGNLELVTYAPPFRYFPKNGEPQRATRRIDASPISSNGRPVAIAGLSLKRLAVIVAQ
jgi:hypothetical protein